MARKHYWQFLVTDEGNPIENAQVSIYIAGTEDPIYAFTDEVGGAYADSDPQVTTSRKGYFEFWIADENEDNGYPLSTKFKIAWQAAGVSSGYIDYVDVFSTSWEPVDETDGNSLKNKALSNLLAYTWEQHRLSELPEENPHGIYVVNELTDFGVDSDGLRNKVVSNQIAYIWDQHAKRQWDGVDEYVTPGYASTPMHGIESINPASITTDTQMNKLVSDNYVKQWVDHVDETNQTPGTDDHPQFALLEGRDFAGFNGYRPFSGLIGYSDSTIVNSAGVDDFVTRGYVDGRKYDELITVWTPVGDGTYTANVTHSLGVDFPMVILWATTPIKEVVTPVSIVSQGINGLVVTVTNPIDHHIRIHV